MLTVSQHKKTTSTSSTYLHAGFLAGVFFTADGAFFLEDLDASELEQSELESSELELDEEPMSCSVKHATCQVTIRTH